MFDSIGHALRHLASIDSSSRTKPLLVRATGQFYTPEPVGRQLARSVVSQMQLPSNDLCRIVDPFAGDGRLVIWLLEEAKTKWGQAFAQRRQVIELWELNKVALEFAVASVSDAAERLGLSAIVRPFLGDTFSRELADDFDVVITNPPWENLKPDRREAVDLKSGHSAKYADGLREYDRYLGSRFPLSQPNKRFSGWGTNLSRVGTELALRLTNSDGICGVVTPVSLFGDQASFELRRHLLTECSLLDLHCYPAEARLFDGVDQPVAFFVARTSAEPTRPISVTVYERDLSVRHSARIDIDPEWLRESQFVIPTGFGTEGAHLFSRFAQLSSFAGLEDGRLWAGRELDETGYRRFVGSTGTHRFVKGRHIGRFEIVERPLEFVSGRAIPHTVKYERLAWRDVSRPSQSRRIQASLIPPGWVSGNSLNVAYFRDNDPRKLLTLLAIMNSLVFEFQVRCLLSTGHISLGSVRKARVPDVFDSRRSVERIARLAERRIERGEDVEDEVDIAVAQAYGLSRDDLTDILACFPKITHEYSTKVLDRSRWPRRLTRMDPALEKPLIQAHVAPRLSALDMEIVRHVPVGGNWKNIPSSVPSSRLEQIRQSFAAGEGSRSTYYGRLKPNAPSYTISTYFTRPGNGCHIHYSQDRVLTFREAARLQSFPDRFVFSGPKTSIAKQIGNAVPPILAFQIAQQIGTAAQFVDLFAGAGGLSLGFQWAGWTPVVANDIDAVFMNTYAANVHEQTVLGDMRDSVVFKRVLELAQAARHDNPESALWVLGGPPCQGFSTAGNKRSMDDDRNGLFNNYAAFIEALRPDGFVFENVLGLLNMAQGRVFELVRTTLSAYMPFFESWTVRAEQQGVPQRRHRVLLVGARRKLFPPAPVTDLTGSPMLLGQVAPAVTVEEAIGDLPPLAPGEDGTGLDYTTEPQNAYQELMRGCITVGEYLRLLREHVTSVA